MRWFKPVRCEGGACLEIGLEGHVDEREQDWHKPVECHEKGKCLEVSQGTGEEANRVYLRSSERPEEQIWLDYDTEWLPFLEAVYEGSANLE